MLPDNFKELFEKNRLLVFVFLIGLVLTLFGGLLAKKGIDLSPAKVEVLESTTSPQDAQEIVVEISGEVEKSGVYKLSLGSRVEDALIAAGGLSENADRDFLEKNLNRAAKLSDGQKIFIPSIGEQSVVLSAKNSSPYQTISEDFAGRGSGLININTATLKELDTLPGIGQVYGQNIIEHRPYSNADELLSKEVLPKSTFDKIKNLVTTY
jgi:competence protein ComEA